MIKNSQTQLAACLIAFFVALASTQSKASTGFEFLPESRHHQYQSYAFFIEQHNLVAWRGASHYWITVGATVPIVGFADDTPWHPQLLFTLSGNDSMHVDGAGGVYTETLDTRIGFAVEFGIPFWELRASIGYFHESGHVVDGVSDPFLGPYNLGDNVFRLRLMRDYGHWLRAGITVVPISHAIPDNLASGADEFVEVFPLGSKEDPHAFSPFAAFGLGNLINPFAGGYSYSVIVGMTAGSHFDSKHTHDWRFVLGFYDGADPRSKYAQFVGDHSTFGYLGAMFNL